MKYNYLNIVPHLQKWYAENARALPWREYKNPYYVWVSEIMLQQTRVEAVKKYFIRFIEELPEIKDLAEVSEEKMMKLWEGLGYYSRVRNMKKTAEILMKRYEGELPADYNLLLSLPGIGSYTAGAIASIAYNLPEPAVDGNVLRVMMRISGSLEDITKDKTKKELEEDLRPIIPVDHPGDFNQAVMELGAVVCIPNGTPLCEKCPIMLFCNAYLQCRQLEIPVKTRKKQRRIEEKTVFVIQTDNSFLLHKRSSNGLLAGLYEIPNVIGKLDIFSAERYIKEKGILLYIIKDLGEAKHIFTHVEWHMKGYHIQIGQNMQELSLLHESLAEQNYTNADGMQEVEYLWIDKINLKKDIMLPSAFAAYHPVNL